MNEKLEKVKSFVLRNSIWLLIIFVSFLSLAPAKAELRTFYLITAIECVALALSAIALKVFTEIDFVRRADGTLGQIFIGVHLCVGLSVLGVYIAQFAP
jgi:hypothetical protein